MTQLKPRPSHKRKRSGVTQPELQVGNPTVAFDEPETMPSTSTHVHYHISTGTRYKVDISEWLGTHVNDPALQVSTLFLNINLY
jgi:hypothetical protein